MKVYSTEFSFAVIWAVLGWNYVEYLSRKIWPITDIVDIWLKSRQKPISNLRNKLKLWKFSVNNFVLEWFVLFLGEIL